MQENKKKEYHKKYYQENKEKIKERTAKWREDNKEYHIQKSNEWLKAHPETRTKNIEKFKETHNWSEYCQNSRRKRVERLREQGCTNAWSVVVKGDEPKFKEEK